MKKIIICLINIKGLKLGFKRLARCHPKGGFGYDPVPEKEDLWKRKF